MDWQASRRPTLRGLVGLCWCDYLSVSTSPLTGLPYQQISRAWRKGGKDSNGQKKLPTTRKKACVWPPGWRSTTQSSQLFLSHFQGIWGERLQRGIRHQNSFRNFDNVTARSLWLPACDNLDVYALREKKIRLKASKTKWNNANAKAASLQNCLQTHKLATRSKWINRFFLLAVTPISVTAFDAKK